MEQKPIVIKRIKKHGHAHHGGSWKVAYADFVTAMMAFFLLMWLMGFTTEGQRQAIADYFQNPSAIQGKGGSSTSMIDTGGGMDAPRTSQKKINQDTMSVMDEDAPTESRGAGLSVNEESKKLMTEADKKRLESLMEELKQAIEASQALKPFKDQLLLDITSEGLRIQIVDKENRPMFDIGSANLQPYTRAILREIAKMVALVPNRISIAGHTDARAYASLTDYSNWELSADRANACRRELVLGGVVDAKFARVVGLASTSLFNKQDPLSPINRRISIVVLNRETDEAMMRGDENKTAAADAPVAESVMPEAPTPAMAPPVPAAVKSEAAPIKPATGDAVAPKKAPEPAPLPAAPKKDALKTEAAPTPTTVPAAEPAKPITPIQGVTLPTPIQLPSLPAAPPPDKKSKP